jgi:hypothetical protein
VPDVPINLKILGLIILAAERRKIYTTKCMPSLMVADYSALENRSKNIETALKEKDKAIQQLTKQVAKTQQQIEHSAKWQALKREMHELKKSMMHLGKWAARI